MEPNGKLSKEEIQPLIQVLLEAEAVLEQLLDLDDSDKHHSEMRRVSEKLIPNRHHFQWQGVISLKYGVDLILSGRHIDGDVYEIIKNHLNQARIEIQTNSQKKSWLQESIDQIISQKQN